MSSSLSPDHHRMVVLLKELQQDHLFEGWEEATEADKIRLLDQCLRLDKTCTGGLKGYVVRARTLLEESRVGANPYEGYVPSVPPGRTVSPESKEGLKAMEIDYPQDRPTGLKLALRFLKA
eukprot:gb/GEZN01033513.1/.p1 GENE.gb/GEZN01033513.1/~~gb/GEZN01033513.1/.p1  ORF type:complete len:121 (+),score=18.03 gb/GEZN01033513.1/:29-391(+)